jgi:glutamyl/glutaminyl-tRNA synthetase
MEAPAAFEKKVGVLTVDAARRALCLSLWAHRKNSASFHSVPEELLASALAAEDTGAANAPDWADLHTPIEECEPSPWGQWSGRTRLAELEELGVLPEAVFNFLAVLGWRAPVHPETDAPREVFSPEELRSLWSPQALLPPPVRFDFELLRRISHAWLQRADLDRLVALAVPYYQRVGWLPEAPSEPVRLWLREVVGAVLPGLDFVSLLPPRTRLVFDYHAENYLRLPESREAMEREGARDVVRAFGRRALEVNWMTPERFREIFAEVRRETHRTGRQLIQPLRVVLTGLPFGPVLDDLIPIFERGAELDLPVRVKPCRERVLEFCSTFI